MILTFNHVHSDKTTFIAIKPCLRPFKVLLVLLKIIALSNETKYSRIDQVKFVEDSLWKTEKVMVCLKQSCLPQILFGPFLNTLSQILLLILHKYYYPWIFSEAVVQICFVKKLFFEVSQNSQGNTCTRVSFLIKRL